MAHFSSGEVRDLVKAIDERRTVCVTGPSRCGLSRWTADFVAERFEGTVDALDGSSLDSAAETTRALRLAGPDGALLDPNRARASHRDGDQTGVVWISNFHLATRDSQRLVARYLFTREGVATVHQAVIVEGAVDVADLVADAFPEGASVGPHVAIAEDGYPWRSLTEVADLAREIAPRLPPLVVPWIVDLTGGDLALAREAINLLRNLEPEDVDGSALTATWRHVCERSVVARAIRRTVGELQCSRWLDLLLAGRVVPGEHISRCEDPELRALFFAGCTSYDRAARAYRLRGPLTALLLLVARGGVDVVRLTRLYSNAAIGARTAVILLELARLELQLRATLLSSNWQDQGSAVTTPTPWKGAAAKAITAVNSAEQVAPEHRAMIARIIKSALPDAQPALEAARNRVPKVGAQDDQLLDYLGLSEILAIAAKAGVLDGGIRTQLDEALVGVRNALAHFRGLEYDAAARALQLSARVLRQLVDVQARAHPDASVETTPPTPDFVDRRSPQGDVT